MIPTKTVVLSSTGLTTWMVINTFPFINNSFTTAVVLFTLFVGGVKYIRFPPLPDTKISDKILSLFKVDPDDPKRNLIFHKGGGNHAPENTLEAIEKAITLGVPSVEIDLEFTKDNVGVVIHGPSVEDTTDGMGLVSDYTFEEIQSLNAAAKDVNKESFPHVRVPTLEAVVELCVQNNIVIFIDCKSKPQQTAGLIRALYEKHPDLYSNGVVCSFYPSVLYAVRKADPEIVTALTHRSHFIAMERAGSDEERYKVWWKRLAAPFLDLVLSWAHHNLLWYILGNSFFLCEKGDISRESKRHWGKLGIRLIAWTVNDPLEREYLNKGLRIPTITDGL